MVGGHSSDRNVLLPDERLDLFVVEDVLREPPPPTGGAEAHGGEVAVQAVPAVHLEVLGQVVGAGEALLAHLTPIEKKGCDDAHREPL